MITTGWHIFLGRPACIANLNAELSQELYENCSQLRHCNPLQQTIKMQASILSSLLFASTAIGHRSFLLPRQANDTTVPSRVEKGIQTECKTCPYSLCTNKAAYEYEQDMTLTCWTKGDTIVDTK